MCKDSSRLHFGHKWLMHFGCANKFLELYHTFFGWDFILGCDAYRWSSSFGKRISYFEHFVFMHNLLTFLFHINGIYIFPFFPIFFGEFQQKSYVGMWRHYGSKIVGVFLSPLNEVSSLITDIFWWYKHFFYGRLFSIYFFKELNFSGFVFVFHVLYFR
jgi:hypothetical protein